MDLNLFQISHLLIKDMLTPITLLNASCSDDGVPVENPMDAVQKLSDPQMAELKLHMFPIPDIGFEVEKTGNYFFIKMDIGQKNFKKYFGYESYQMKGKITVSNTPRYKICNLFRNN